MGRIRSTRLTDATFDLNLAPFLDIIVSIVPMLLLSVAFVQVKMIEAPTPQVVAADQVKTPPKPETSIALRVSKTHGLVFEVTDPQGKVQKSALPNKGAEYDMAGLLSAAQALKKAHPDISKLQLLPEQDVSFEDLVKVMDGVRETPAVATPASYGSEPVAPSTTAARQLFSDIIFGNVGG